MEGYLTMLAVTVAKGHRPSISGANELLNAVSKGIIGQ